MGGWPSPGFAVLQLAPVWQAKQVVAEKKAAEEAEKVPSSPHWMYSVSVALRATRAHALSGNNVFIRTVRCVGPPPCDCVCACVRRGGGGDCVFVRIAVVADSMTPLRARQSGQAASVL